MGKEWEEEAGRRGLTGTEAIQVAWGPPSSPLTGPPAAAVGSRRFEPLPGLAPATEAALAAGQINDLHALYGGLGSGRLVIAGPPGSGKSGAAVLLVLAAVRHRGQVAEPDKRKVPVPVLVTAQDWNPHTQLFRDWLTRRLQETYPLFTGGTGASAAAAMIDAGKVTVILDGLDEIDVELQPVALQALSQQATFRIVVLSRTADLASAAASRGVLQGAAAIELHAIKPFEATSYLERVQLDPPPDGWRDLIEHVRSAPASPLSKALDSPLTLSLIRDTYQSGDDVRELLGLCDFTTRGVSSERAADDIVNRLLDRVLCAAYAHHPGERPVPYDLPTARNALSRIAARMDREGTYSLQWWDIPAWASRVQRAVLAGIAFGLGVELIWGALASGAGGLASGFTYGLVPALDPASPSVLGAYAENDTQRRVSSDYERR